MSRTAEAISRSTESVERKLDPMAEMLQSRRQEIAEAAAKKLLANQVMEMFEVVIS